MEVDLGNEKISTDALFLSTVASSSPVSDMVARSGAVAGVNGDFFDINRTDAPLGAMIHLEL